MGLCMASAQLALIRYQDSRVIIIWLCDEFLLSVASKKPRPGLANQTPSLDDRSAGWLVCCCWFGTGHKSRRMGVEALRFLVGGPKASLRCRRAQKVHMPLPVTFAQTALLLFSLLPVSRCRWSRTGEEWASSHPMTLTRGFRHIRGGLGRGIYVPLFCSFLSFSHTHPFHCSNSLDALVSAVFS